MYSITHHLQLNALDGSKITTKRHPPINTAHNTIIEKKKWWRHKNWIGEILGVVGIYR